MILSHVVIYRRRTLLLLQINYGCDVAQNLVIFDSGYRSVTFMPYQAFLLPPYMVKNQLKTSGYTSEPEHIGWVGHCHHFHSMTNIQLQIIDICPAVWMACMAASTHACIAACTH